MNNENSLKPNERKKLRKSNSQKNFMNSSTFDSSNASKNKKLNIDLSCYYKLIQNNNNNNFHKKIYFSKDNKDKNNSHASNEVLKDNQKKESILYKKFLEFKNNYYKINKSPRKQKKSDSKLKNNKKAKELNKGSNSSFTVEISKIFKKMPNIIKKNSNSNLNSKKMNKNIKNENTKENKKESKSNINKNYKKKKSANLIKKPKALNNIINNNEEINNKTFKRINSSQNLNNDKLKKEFEIKDKQNINNKNEENKKRKSKNNMTLNLISKKYFEKMRFNKYKYYNEKSTEYANQRRKRVEDKINEILKEKYKIERPLRMTERIFCAEEENESDIDNKRIYDNNMCKALNNNIIDNLNLNIYNYLNNYKDNNINNQSEEIDENCSQIIYYNNQINNIDKMRKYLSIEDFFEDFRREYNLLDFNFTCLYRNFKNY